MAYADGSDLVKRYDARILSFVSNDDDTPVALADVPTHPAVLQALDDASGSIDAALRAGGRYSAEDLSGLTGTAMALLKRVNCDIAKHYLSLRRMSTTAEEEEKSAEVAERILKQIRTGEIVFVSDPQIEATLPEHPLFLEQDVLRNNTLRDRIHNYFPNRRYPQV